jgi:uncharacterized coiled-coil protein SlyX
MLLDLVSKARSGGTSAEIEAILAERDFFRERYAEQIQTIEHLNVKLKETQRVVDKLRSQILDLELEKKSRGGDVDDDVTTSQIEERSSSCGNAEDPTSSSSRVGCSRVVDEPSKEVETSLDVGIDAELPSSPQQVANKINIERVSKNAASSLDDEHSTPIEDEGGEENDDDDEPSSDNDENEAEQIRANAERMLQWANYQSSKRSTPNTSMNFDSLDDGNNDNESSNCEATSSTFRSSTPTRSASEDNYVAHSIPKSLDERKSLLDDNDDGDSSLGSSSTTHHSSEQVVRTGANTRGGKIGKLFNNLRDMIEGPPSESDSEAESDDLSND